MIIISHKNKLCQVIEPELLLFAPAAQAMLFVLLFAGKEKKAILGFGTQDRFLVFNRMPKATGTPDRNPLPSVELYDFVRQPIAFEAQAAAQRARQIGGKIQKIVPHFSGHDGITLVAVFPHGLKLPLGLLRAVQPG